jgi:hypothetical protein
MKQQVKIGRITQLAITDEKKSRTILSYEPLWSFDFVANPWTPFEMDKNYLTGKNFKSAQCLAFDFDNVPGKYKYLSLKDAVSKFESYECIIGTTRSHQIVKKTCPTPVDRYRVILVLDKPITDGVQYAQNYSFYADILGVADSIDACGDLARYFFPFKEVVFENRKGSVLPVQEKEEVIKRSIGAVPLASHRGDYGINTKNFINGITSKGSRHDAAKDAVTELRKLNYNEDEILQLLEPGFLALKPEAPDTELPNLINWAMDNIEPETVKKTIKKPLRKATTYLISKQKNNGIGLDEYNKAITDMLHCGYNTLEIIDVLLPILNKTNPEESLDTLTELVEYIVRQSQEGNRVALMLAALERTFSDKVRVYRDSAGSERLFKYEGTNILKPLGTRNLLVDFTEELAKLGFTDLLAKEIKELFETFLLKTKNTLKILPPSFTLDAEELSFNYIKLDIKEGPTPTWDDFIERCGENGKALMAYTWSIFERDVKLPQYLMLQGHGNDGKGSYTEWLSEIIGDQAYSSLDAANPHWPSQCIGRRVGFWQELNSPKIVMSSQFKAITGGDAVSITEKYEKAITTSLDIKFILVTNQLPEFTSKAAEQRRIILATVRPPSHVISGYKIKIRQESAAFLYKCRRAFEELYNKELLKIDCGYTDFAELSGSFEEQYSWLFEKCFIQQESKFITDGVVSADFIDTIKVNQKNLDRNFMNGFKEWLYRTKGVSCRPSGGTRYYTGISLKNLQLLRSV